MKKYWLIIILLLWVLELLAVNSIDSLFIGLDHTLSNSRLYMEQKENRLDRQKMQLTQALSSDIQYDIIHRIIEEYKSYKSDSALVYIHKNIQLANRYTNMNWLIHTKLQYAFVLSSSGLFTEAESVLKSIPYRQMDPEMLIEYYKGWELLYINLCIYQEGKQMVTDYIQLIRECREAILHALPDSAPDQLYYKYLIANSDNKSDSALIYLESHVQTLHPGTHEHAKKMYHLSALHKKMGNTERQIADLILAVMSDIKDAIKENRALLELAIWLYDQGEIDRAYSYIQYALDDAIFYNARLRYFEISKALPMIAFAYQKKNDDYNTGLKNRLYIIGFLSLVMLVLIVFIYKQMRALKSVRKTLEETNAILQKANYRLHHLNNELSEANHTKEKYIGYFLDLCSQYIGYFEEYRKTVTNKIAAKRFNELSRLASTSPDKANEIKKLYAHFDRAFLAIYPEFVSSINGLLTEDAHFDIKKGDLLNTELRIFALIRLGITDSVKIATILRCSLQTVYNYRSKIKRSSINESKDIEEQIKKIGIPDK